MIYTYLTRFIRKIEHLYIYIHENILHIFRNILFLVLELYFCIRVNILLLNTKHNIKLH